MMQFQTFISRTACPGLVLALGVLCAPPASADTFDCILKPSMLLKIGSPVSTTLQTVEVERGQRISRGQVIARLESKIQAADLALDEARTANRADVLSHQAKVEFAQAEDSRAERLLQTNNIPRQKVEELRTNLRVAQEELQIAVTNYRLLLLQLERSKALLEQRTIRSPIDGVVVQRLLGPGEYVHQEAPIAEVAQLDPLFVETYPPVRVAGAIREGMTGLVQPEGASAETHRASVTVVDRLFDAASGTFGVRLAFANPGSSLPAGLRCRVTFTLADAGG